MKTFLDIDSWSRKELFYHFRTLADPTFSVVVNVDVTKSYRYSKEFNQSFFARYLHACMKAINSIENFKYRLENDNVAVYDIINASATIARNDNTFGFSYINFSEKLSVFNSNFLEEKARILNSTNLFPPKYSPNCIHCSALPWLHFTAHKEPFSGNKNDSVPQLSFGKVKQENKQLIMPVALNVNHALIDGYHVGQFFDKFQEELNKID